MAIARAVIVQDFHVAISSDFGRRYRDKSLKRKEKNINFFVDEHFLVVFWRFSKDSQLIFSAHIYSNLWEVLANFTRTSRKVLRSLMYNSRKLEGVML